LGSEISPKCEKIQIKEDILLKKENLGGEGQI
jgi:hypothetical protein